MSLDRRGFMSAVTVFIADPHPVYRRGMASIVRRQGDMRLLGVAARVPSVAQLADEPPDVLVADPVIVSPREFWPVRALACRRLQTRVLLVASVVRDGDAYAALAAGAHGFLSKCSDEGDLVDAIRRVAGGETIIAPELQGDVALDIRMREVARRPVLSMREHQILELSAEGLTAPEMGRHLHLAPATVKSHMLSLYDKLGVRERAAAVARGMRLGLIE
jgi:two-component system nitrate/nitrite response regulator NarL